MTNEQALTTIEHAISYLLTSNQTHAEINDACDILYAGHKAIGPLGEIPSWEPIKNTFEVKSPKNLDTIERTWRKNGTHPLTEAGQFPVNNAHKVTRVSDAELRVVTTENVTLLFTVR
jgi:hypothetical protein